MDYILTITRKKPKAPRMFAYHGSLDKCRQIGYQMAGRNHIVEIYDNHFVFVEEIKEGGAVYVNCR